MYGFTDILGRGFGEVRLVTQVTERARCRVMHVWGRRTGTRGNEWRHASSRTKTSAPATTRAPCAYLKKGAVLKEKNGKELPNILIQISAKLSPRTGSTSVGWRSTSVGYRIFMTLNPS